MRLSYFLVIQFLLLVPYGLLAMQPETQSLDSIASLETDPVEVEPISELERQDTIAWIAANEALIDWLASPESSVTAFPMVHDAEPPTPPAPKRTRIRTEQLPFHCQYCPYTTTKHSCLVTHMRIHSSERPYKCPYCDYTAKHYPNLIAHMKTHRDKQS